MKKIFSILAVAAIMTACNNSAEEKTTKTDSLSTSNPAADAMKTDSSATKMMADSTHKMDSAHKAIDSTKMK